MSHENLNNIPIIFKKIGDYKIADTRFIPVEITLMHLDDNFNGSYFSKKIVQEAIPSLANTPILAYIENNSDDEEDFSDHRRVLMKDEKNGYSFEYLGVAIGLIPEDNNARFEERDDGTGKKRTYLIVDGLVWTKWKKPLKIFENRGGKVSQSMELHSDFEGEIKKDGLFHFSKFKFFGACALGRDVLPAMTGTNIQLNFTMEDFVKEVQTKMEEYKFFQLNKSKGGNLMELKLDLISKFSKTEEDIKELGIDLEEISFEDLESRLNEDASTNTNPDDDKADEDKDNSDSGDNSGDDSVKDDDDNKVEDDNVEDDDSNKDEGDGHEDDEELNYQELYEKLKADHEKLQEDFTTLENDVEDLRNFKKTRLAEDRKADEEALFEKYSMLDGIDEFEALKEKSSDFSKIKDLEKEIALVFATNHSKLNFSKNEQEDKNRFNFDNTEKKNTKYGDLFDRFGK